MDMHWSPMWIGMLIVFAPLLIVIGIFLVPIIFGLVCIVFGVLVFLANIALLPFAWVWIQIRDAWNQKKERDEWEELEEWKREHPADYEFARKNPGATSKGDDQ